jgi:hypothetical protein
MATTSATSGLRPVLRRYPVLFGFVLMFACTWPIDLWAAAASHGWVSVAIPPVLPIFVGYGFVVAGTGGSLLSVTLLHATLNTAVVSLPVLPAVTGDTKVVVTTMVLHIAIAVAIVVVTGPGRLTRSPHIA